MANVTFLQQKHFLFFTREFRFIAFENETRIYLD
jgi:hypothetical protein